MLRKWIGKNGQTRLYVNHSLIIGGKLFIVQKTPVVSGGMDYDIIRQRGDEGVVSEDSIQTILNEVAPGADSWAAFLTFAK